LKAEADVVEEIMSLLEAAARVHCNCRGKIHLTSYRRKEQR